MDVFCPLRRMPNMVFDCEWISEAEEQIIALSDTYSLTVVLTSTHASRSSMLHTVYYAMIPLFLGPMSLQCGNTVALPSILSHKSEQSRHRKQTFLQYISCQRLLCWSNAICKLCGYTYNLFHKERQQKDQDFNIPSLEGAQQLEIGQHNFCDVGHIPVFCGRK